MYHLNGKEDDSLVLPINFKEWVTNQNYIVLTDNNTPEGKYISGFHFWADKNEALKDAKKWGYPHVLLKVQGAGMVTVGTQWYCGKRTINEGIAYVASEIRYIKEIT